MSETVPERSGKPGAVIFAAILNFFSAAALFSLAAFAALATLFGAAWGVDEYVSRQVSQFAPDPNFSYGVTVVLGLAVAVFLAFGLFFLVIGIGLLRGRKYAWYLQAAMSTFGLLGLPLSFLTGALMLPLGSVLNIVLLVLFFQPRVRGYFRV